MPGMMDTISSINDDAVLGIDKKTGNLRFALDSYRRFIEMFGEVVMGIDKEQFDEVIQKKKWNAASGDSSLQEGDLKDIIKKYKNIITKYRRDVSPAPGNNCAWRDAVFQQYPRAVGYRHINHIPQRPAHKIFRPWCSATWG
jgi:pyruvate,orthophosphate dikinase